MNLFRRLVMLIFWAAILSTGLAHAGIWLDPKPAMGWKDLVNCELVVLARYESHQGDKLKLKVQRVLKGPAKPGDVLTVNLEHLYSIETGELFAETWVRPTTQPDGIPRLCYKTQIENPGDPVPVRIVPDCRKEELYFLPNAGAPALTRDGQVQPALLTDGWQQALEGKPADLLFRLVQQASYRVRRDALEEFYAKRDPKTIVQLLDWICNAPLREYSFGYGNFWPDEVLLAIRDKDGKIYNRLMDIFTGKVTGRNPYAAPAAGYDLGRLDPTRAFRDLSGFIRNDPIMRIPALRAIATADGEQVVPLMIELLKEKEPVGTLALEALGAALRPSYQERSWPGCDPARRDRLRSWAKPKLVAALTQPDIPDGLKKGLRFCIDSLVLPAPPPADKDQAAEQPPGKAKIDEMVTYVKSQLQIESGYPPLDQIETLLRQAPERGQPLLAEAVAGRAKFHAYYKAQVLAMAIRQGQHNLAAELVAAVRQGIKAKEPSFPVTSFGALLLKSNDSEAEREYLKILRDMPKTESSPWSVEEFPSREYGELLTALAPDHLDDFVPLIIPLLESDWIEVRRMGQGALTNSLGWDFGFDAAAFAQPRAERMKVIRPHLEKLATMLAPRAREYVERLKAAEE